MKNNFTIANYALLMIDHQQGIIKPARNLPHAEIVKNTRAP
jgi:nicotinamidase-related amidase